MARKRRKNKRTKRKNNQPFFKKQQKWIYLIIIIALSMMVYLNTLNNDFAYDDSHLVENNPAIRSWKNFSEIARPSQRPVRAITYMIDYSIWKLNPFGFHLTNIFLHAIAAALLFLFLNHFLDKNLSFLVTLLFALHPIQTEAVAAIANRKEMLMSAFFLLAFILYLKKSKHWIFFVLSYICYGFALLSKEVAVTLPVMVFVYDWYFKDKRTLKKNIPLYALYVLPIIAGALIIFGTDRFPNFFSVEHTRGLPYPRVFATSMKAFPHYLKLLLFPFRLSADHYFPPVESPFEILAIFAFIFFIIYIASIFVIKKSSKLLSFGLLWILINWLPISNLVPSVYFLAERYLYFPSIGFCLILGLGLMNLIKYKKWVGLGASALILVIYAGTTINRNNDWKNDFTLWSDAVKLQPGNPQAHFYLGNAYREKGNYARAEQHYRKSLSIEPRQVRALTNMGNMYSEKGEFENAIIAYEKALALERGKVYKHTEFIYNNLGTAYFRLQNYEKAIENFTVGIAIDPNSPDIFLNRGNAYARLKKFDKAEEDYQQALRLNPNMLEVYKFMGLTYIQSEDFDKAIGVFNEYLKRDRQSEGALRVIASRGLAFNRKGEYRKALQDFSTAIKMNPYFGEPYRLMGMTYSEMGEIDLAIKSFEKYLQLESDSPYAKYVQAILQQLKQQQKEKK